MVEVAVEQASRLPSTGVRVVPLDFWGARPIVALTRVRDRRLGLVGRALRPTLISFNIPATAPTARLSSPPAPPSFPSCAAAAATGARQEYVNGGFSLSFAHILLHTPSIRSTALPCRVVGLALLQSPSYRQKFHLNQPRGMRVRLAARGKSQVKLRGRSLRLPTAVPGLASPKSACVPPLRPLAHCPMRDEKPGCDRSETGGQ